MEHLCHSKACHTWLTWLAGGDRGHPAAVGLALGPMAAPQHEAWVALEGDVVPRVVHGPLAFSHLSILDAGAGAGDHWEGKAAELRLGKRLPELRGPLWVCEVTVQGRQRDHGALPSTVGNSIYSSPSHQG